MTPLKLSPFSSLTVQTAGADVLEVEALYAPGGPPPPPHLHPAQAEHFEVLEGGVTTRVDGQERTLHVGDTLDIPQGAVHQMWNPGTEPARVLWRTTPAGRTLEWFQVLDELQRAGRVVRDGAEVPGEELLTEYSDVFQVAPEHSSA
jgi:mannose-6-phosphate isomerase-like protein (cupin superfamily)